MSRNLNSRTIEYTWNCLDIWYFGRYYDIILLTLALYVWWGLQWQVRNSQPYPSRYQSQGDSLLKRENPRGQNVDIAPCPCSTFPDIFWLCVLPLGAPWPSFSFDGLGGLDNHLISCVTFHHPRLPSTLFVTTIDSYWCVIPQYPLHTPYLPTRWASLTSWKRLPLSHSYFWQKRDPMHAYNMASNVPFLDLPGEIRNMVYRHALINEEPIRPHRKILQPSPRTHSSQQCHLARGSIYRLPWSHSRGVDEYDSVDLIDFI